MTSLSGLRVLITGGSKGIGQATAAHLLSQGAKVIITGRNQSSLNEAMDRLNVNDDQGAKAFAADVRNRKAINLVVSWANHHWDGLDVLIANAGIGHFASIEDMSIDQWNDVIDINLTGVFNSVQACLPSLIRSKGYIITMASLAGTNFFANGAAYNASKFGLVGMTQAIMLDVRHKGVKVTTIMPGSVATEFNNNTISPADSWKIQPEDIAEMVANLLSINPRTLPSKIEVRPSQPPVRH